LSIAPTFAGKLEGHGTLLSLFIRKMGFYSNLLKLSSMSIDSTYLSKYKENLRNLLEHPKGW
jgi:hypothetical protein